MTNVTFRAQKLFARDLAERLMPGGHEPSEFLAWPPNLFAFTSYILTQTGAYQLVISPPTKHRWFPTEDEIKKWLDKANAENNITEWLNAILPKGWIENEYKIDEIQEFTVLEDELKRRHNEKQSKQNKKYEFHLWRELVVCLGEEWYGMFRDITQPEFNKIRCDNNMENDGHLEAVLKFVVKRTPWKILACWAYFYNKVMIEFDENKAWWENKKSHKKSASDLQNKRTLPIAFLLSNQDLPPGKYNIDELWTVAHCLLTLHAICDEACVGWGVLPIKTKGQGNKMKAESPQLNAKYFAHHLLMNFGTMATIEKQRCRVMPKRHNPSLGITLRSLSSNLAFNRLAVDVVWRQSKENDLSKKLLLKKDADDNPSGGDEETDISILLLPFPDDTRTGDFSMEKPGNTRVDLVDKHEFFSYNPARAVSAQTVEKIVRLANANLGDNKSVDIVILPELSINASEIEELEVVLRKKDMKSPSIYVAGVVGDVLEKLEPKIRPKKTSTERNDDFPKFGRNQVICRYLDPENKYSDDKGHKKTLKEGLVPKFVQHKHHRWRLDESQVRSYGLSRVLDPKKTHWESIRVPKRRVSFLNIGDRMTLCHLICEDLARQDPIADLIRHVGPSLVIAILLDGPQRLDRWPSKYASVLSEDPGSSVITLTNIGMVRRWSSPYRSTSKAVALWSEKNVPPREIELAQDSLGILLNLKVKRDS